MIPEDRRSTVDMPSRFIVPERKSPYVDYEWGGVALNDPSQGLMVKVWAARYDPRSAALYLSAPGVDQFLLFGRPGISEIGLAFDQNMNPFVCFVQNKEPWVWWYDPLVQEQVFTQDLMPLDAKNPRCTLDDGRKFNVSGSDIILAYARDGAIRHRKQRERFATERTFSGSGTGLWQLGMGSNMRLEAAYYP